VIHETVDLVPASSRILAMALSSAGLAGVAAFVYRWYSGHSIPEGVAVLLGVSLIAVWLNTTATFRRTLVAGELVGEGAAAFTLVAFAVGTLGADLGRRTGERLGAGLPSVDSVRTIDGDVGQFVRAAGRVIRVTVPDHVGDIDGYEPMAESAKADLAGTTFLFPRRLTVPELRERFVERLKRDYDVGHVDVELARDGTVEYLALGRRLAGIGQTIAPGTVAVAIRADPAFSATPGDRVQVWRDAATPDREFDAGTEADAVPGAAATGTEPDAEAGSDATGRSQPERVVAGELRAAVGDVATVAVDEADAGALADDERYRIVTMPSEVQPDREFAALLRSADETMASVEVEPGSELAAATVEDVGLTVAAVRSGGEVETIPTRDRSLAAGDAVYVIGRLDAIRKLEARAAATGASESTTDVPQANPGAED